MISSKISEFSHSFLALLFQCHECPAPKLTVLFYHPTLFGCDFFVTLKTNYGKATRNGVIKGTEKLGPS